MVKSSSSVIDSTTFRFVQEGNIIRTDEKSDSAANFENLIFKD